MGLEGADKIQRCLVPLATPVLLEKAPPAVSANDICRCVGKSRAKMSFQGASPIGTDTS